VRAFDLINQEAVVQFDIDAIADIRYVDLCESKREVYVCAGGYWRPYLGIHDFSGKEK
jgi:hypothetical protein